MASKSNCQTVAEYMAAVQLDRQAAISQLRKLCRSVLKGYKEGIAYGMPAYSKNGKVDVAFASQKQYISLYILKTEVVAEHRPLLAGLNTGKGCIRYSSVAKMNFEVIEKLLRASAASAQDPC